MTNASANITIKSNNNFGCSLTFLISAIKSDRRAYNDSKEKIKRNINVADTTNGLFDIYITGPTNK
ncbi:hypothetical protein [Weissella minor]|uniref:hypothetical protein n=1 Tax=Weissella minor TaxID=1620 RepID=UPI000708C675|nr:hypothetical protein [Weissella minor]